jgi:uncharacterized membrane protein HdeD (DUF308 family)
MDNLRFTSIKDTIKHWYLLLILGIIFIVIGIWALITPVETYLSLAILFSAAFFVTGILEIISSITFRNQLSEWGWPLAAGILNSIIGLILILKPGISIIALPLFVGFVVLYSSMMGIAWSIELKKFKISNLGWLLFLSILGVVFSFVLLWNPIFAGLTVAVLTGIALIITGTFHIYLSFVLKKIKAAIQK